MSLITSVQVDIETGEIISPVVEKVQLGKGIMMGGKFFKVYDRTWNHIHEKFIGKFLDYLNNFFIRIWKSLFAYQIICMIKPNKSLDMLLSKAKNKIKDDKREQ